MTEVKEFGFYRGYKCFLITLSNEKGFRASFTNLGAAMQSLYVPDRNGNPEDVVLGYDTCDASKEAFDKIAEYEGSEGVLAICPATMTYPEDKKIVVEELRKKIAEGYYPEKLWEK